MLQGRELAVLEPNSLGNHDLAVSVDGRFIAVASFTSEVKLWEVKYSRDVGDITGKGNRGSEEDCMRGVMQQGQAEGGQVLPRCGQHHR